MKAIVQNDYGGPEVLSMAEVFEPEIKDDEVKVEVYASSVNAGDYFSMSGHPWLVRLTVGFPRPRNYILGWDVAGKVVGTGENVHLFKKDDLVYGAVKSAFAEFIAAPESMLAKKPTSLTVEQAAAVPTTGITALQGLRDKGMVTKHQKVLVNGASGGVGSFAVQIAKHFGAEVTGVCSKKNKELVESLGADRVIDYTTQDFTTGSERYDLIFDNVGNHTFRSMGSVLNRTGKIIPNTGHAGMGYVMKAFMLRPFSRKMGPMYLANPNTRDLDFLTGLLDKGIIRPAIDRSYPFQKIPEALGYLGKGHAQGKVVITIKNGKNQKQ